MNKFAGERAETKQVPYKASGTTDEKSEHRNNAPWGSDAESKAMTSPAIQHTAIQHTGTTILELEELVASAENRMQEQSVTKQFARTK